MVDKDELVRSYAEALFHTDQDRLAVEVGVWVIVGAAGQHFAVDGKHDSVEFAIAAEVVGAGVPPRISGA